MIQNSPDLINAPDNDGWTPLLHAASAGQLRVATYLLDNDADVEARNRSRNTALFLAASEGHKAMVELLLNRGADVNAHGIEGRTALHQAALRGFSAVAEVLLAHNAEVNATNSAGQTPLHIAADRGDLPLIKLLLAKGADVNAGDKSGSTPLHSAAQSGQTATIKVLLDAKADINARNKQGETPLLVAAKYGKSDAAMALLAAGADPKLATTRPNYMNISPLHWAVAAGDEVLTRALLEHGANPNLAASPRPTSNVTPSGNFNYAGGGPGSALITACEQGGIAIAKILLEHGADPNVRYTGSDQMPLLFEMWNNPEILRLLLEHKADPNLTRADGETTLHAVAASGGSTNSVALLVEHGANVNAQAEGGSTPLHLAVERNHPEIAAALLAFKADPNIRNNQGQTPLDLTKGPQSPGTIPGRIMALPPPLPSFGMPGSQQQPSVAPAIDLAALLREHGALSETELPHWDRITVRRPSANYSIQVFQKGTNDWNHFTLTEVIACVYGFVANPRSGGPWSVTWNISDDQPGLPRPLAFPDFSRVVIRRPAPGGTNWTSIPVNAAEILSLGRDVTLHWGDVVEIPEADHAVTERWHRLADPDMAALSRLVSRTFTIAIGGTNTTFKLAPYYIEHPPNTWPTNREAQELVVGGAKLMRVSFMVRSVLDESKLIRFSSDLTRVKVTRRDTATGKTQSWLLDCSNPNNSPDLWLRDGDVIEVPET